MYRQLAAIALATSVDPEGDSLEDVSFNLLTSWLHSCLSKSQADKLDGYSSYVHDISPQAASKFQSLTEDEKADVDFLRRVHDKDALKEFLEPLAPGYEHLGYSFEDLFSHVEEGTNLVNKAPTE